MGYGEDKYMQREEVKEVLLNLEKKYSVDSAVEYSDNEKEELQKLHSKERFKAMKELDEENERASSKLIDKL